MLPPSSGFQYLVDKTLGTMGRTFGVSHSVYRLRPNSSGHFPEGWRLLTNQAMVLKNRIRSGSIDAALTSERALWYELAADMSRFALGDVFVENSGTFFPGIAYGAAATSMADTREYNGFALAWHATTQPPVGARCDRRVGIYRPLLTPENGQWRSTHERDRPLVLTNGVYAWGAPGDPASWVPAGFATSDRQTRGEDMPPDPPGMLPVPRYYAYLPAIPGWTPSEGDAILDEDDSRYVIIAPYTQRTGTVGSQVMMQRYISQND